MLLLGLSAQRLGLDAPLDPSSREAKLSGLVSPYIGIQGMLEGGGE